MWVEYDRWEDCRNQVSMLETENHRLQSLNRDLCSRMSKRVDLVEMEEVRGKLKKAEQTLSAIRVILPALPPDPPWKGCMDPSPDDMQRLLRQQYMGSLGLGNLWKGGY